MKTIFIIFLLLLIILIAFLIYKYRNNNFSIPLKDLRPQKVRATYRSDEGEFSVLGNSDTFTVTKNADYEFSVEKGKIKSVKRLSDGVIHVYKEESDGNS
ncbi:hypothetical protein M2149_000924 [Lachnospiraceae bacterium PFB1-21]